MLIRWKSKDKSASSNQSGGGNSSTSSKKKRKGREGGKNINKCVHQFKNILKT